MNDELLAEARHAQERLIDAERDVEVARAEFHRAVRRLHLHGSSLREVAANLGLSHQRVHQIVEEAGGSRRWVRIRSRSREVLLACSFCGKPQNKVRKLIAGPSVYICGGCVELVKNVISSGQAARTELGPVDNVPGQLKRERCNFCGKPRDQVTGLAAIALEGDGQGGTDGRTAGATGGGAKGKPAGTAMICSECLVLCDEIITEEFNLNG
jgi:hypothetical protein